ncbi:MAG TPA: hypothetical protein VG324_13560, partial [Blastocatellia bacterium]|nr:hypothetical protein [Blastocatellia bacterium]
MAHLPPDLASQENLKTTFSTNWPPHTRAEGGQAEPVLACIYLSRSKANALDHMFKNSELIGICWY